MGNPNMRESEMSFRVYDSRTDSGSVFITPEIRAIFQRMEPGGVSGGHTHDLGHELFVVLEGRVEFEIDGEREELGPGQMCVALAGQMHFLRVVGDEPATLYYTVTPHIQPTHTQWTKPYGGERLPHGFTPSTRDYTGIAMDDLVNGYVDAAQAVADAIKAGVMAQREKAAELKKALADGDEDAATRLRNTMWDALFPIYKSAFALAPWWNELATRGPYT